MHKNDGVRFTSSSLKIPPLSPLQQRQQEQQPLFSQILTSQLVKTKICLTNFIDSLINRSLNSIHPEFRTRRPNLFSHIPLLCSASLSLPRLTDSSRPETPIKSPILSFASLSLSQPSEPSQPGSDALVTQPKGSGGGHSVIRHDEERVLISEVLVRNKDGEELERKDLEAEALAALKASRANSALTVREVQEDVLRIIDSGYFCSCMPVAVDTRDGIRLVFQKLVSCGLR